MAQGNDEDEKEAHAADKLGVMLSRVAQDPASAPAFYAALMDAELFAVAEKAGDKLQFQIETVNGRKVICLYTSLHHMTHNPLNEGKNYVRMQGRQLLELAAETRQDAALNAFSAGGGLLTAKKIGELLEGTSTAL